MSFVWRWHAAAHMRITATCLAGVLATFALAVEPDVAAGTRGGKGLLTVRMIGFRDDQGLARVSLFRDPNGFPGDTNLAFRTMTAAITNAAAVVEFVDIPFGEYAVGVLHDENGNARMDTNWLGFPREGYGESNNPGAETGRPSFESARFVLESISRVITIQLVYLGAGGLSPEKRGGEGNRGGH